MKSIYHNESRIWLWGNITTDEAAKLIRFVEGIELEILGFLNEKTAPPEASDLPNYKIVLAISKENNEYRVSVRGGKPGNTIIIKRIQCGLTECDFKIRYTMVHIVIPGLTSCASGTKCCALRPFARRY